MQATLDNLTLSQSWLKYKSHQLKTRRIKEFILVFYLEILIRISHVKILVHSDNMLDPLVSACVSTCISLLSVNPAAEELWRI